LLHILSSGFGAPSDWRVKVNSNSPGGGTRTGNRWPGANQRSFNHAPPFSRIRFIRGYRREKVE
jgi:hypothetical protein